ncbi:MAG: hypothetical protein J6Y37_00080 [Paludibacteraceae bacterium]|nr:hypothetical protein [Paludibacteraceae bacterium]
MNKYRIKHRYPCYSNGSCIPQDGYFVQVLQKGIFRDKWIDVKGFDNNRDAKELLEIIKS